MSLQHVQQYVAELYDYNRPNWSTPESSYARSYLEHLEGKRGEPRPPQYLGAARASCIRERVQREMKR